MDVPQLVQEQRFVEPLALVEENRPAKSKAGHVRSSEGPSPDPKRKSPDAKPRLEKLRKPLRQFPW
jgi:hypothetical protein